MRLPVMPEPGARIVAAMSGGVDSSVAAALLSEQGYEVIGISLRLADEASRNDSSGCCSLEDFRDAERVATKLGIAHYVFDMREPFSHAVIQPFVEDYLAGRTPSPCILCNREIKFRLLHRKAAELGAFFVATGHYARREHRDGRFRLLRGRDATKDQSYFLFEMGQAELARTLFPVGHLDKKTVREEAEKRGLYTAEKPDSQEICFVADGRYSDFVERIAAERIRPGAIVDSSGRRLGSHAGVQRFTIGQRRGLGVSAEQPLYVGAIDSRSATVTVGPKEELSRADLHLRSVVWTAGEPEAAGSRMRVQIRYRHEGADALLIKAGAGSATLCFDRAQEAICPGQAAVFYRDEEVLGGGWIASELSAREERASACA